MTAEPDPTPATPAVETDPVILDGTWRRIDRLGAEAALGGDIVAVPGLPIESLAEPTADGRSGVRVVQRLESGEQLEIVIEAPDFLAASRGAGLRATAIRVMVPADPADPAAASARYGGYLITAKAAVEPEALRDLIASLTEPG